MNLQNYSKFSLVDEAKVHLIYQRTASNEEINRAFNFLQTIIFVPGCGRIALSYFVFFCLFVCLFFS